MPRLAFLLTFTAGCVILAGCGSKADDGPPEPPDPTEYPITLKERAAGTTVNGSLKVRLRIELSGDGLAAVVGLSGPIEMTQEVTYTETILEQPTGTKKPTKARIRFDRWETSGSGPLFSDLRTVGRVVGRDILFENSGGFDRVFAEDGGPIDPNVQIFLEGRHNALFHAAEFLPSEPVGCGGKWDIPVKRLIETLGPLPFDGARSKGYGRLMHVFTQNGRQYGRIELEATLYPSAVGSEIRFSDSARIPISTTINTCIDGSLHDLRAEARVDTTLELVVRGQLIRVNINGNVTLNETEMQK